MTAAAPDLLRGADRLVVGGVDVFAVEIPWASPDGAGDGRAYRWAFGVKENAAAVLVRLTTREGYVGWGEATCLFHPAMPARLLAEAIESMAPLLIGQRVTDVERFLAGAYNTLGWHFARGFGNYAISGLEMAMWDLIGRAAGLPLCDLFGGRCRDRIEVMYFVYRDEPEQMCAEAVRAVADGYRCIYAKVGLSMDDDVELVRALRAAIGDDVTLRVDANEAWSSGTAVRVIDALEPCRLEFVEQPVMAQDLAGLASVRRRVTTPICADQAARTPHAVLDVIRADAADLISLCPGDAGGLTSARKCAAIAEAAGVPCFIHSNIELGIATAAHLHLAASLPHCHFASQTEYQFIADDVLTERLAIVDGCFAVPTGPGLGVEVDEDRVRRYAATARRDGAAPPASAAITAMPGY